ncbi:unnamed protein product [Oikopleura dioica]|uniref:Uncharacterized protein n=1 Tax=Oikopleura dioica TaxID=34765 RepID=E4Y7R4_OIKDI|nr:unnamed protein product [Oikopleura dioica]
MDRKQLTKSERLALAFKAKKIDYRQGAGPSTSAAAPDNSKSINHNSEDQMVVPTEIYGRTMTNLASRSQQNIRSQLQPRSEIFMKSKIKPILRRSLQGNDQRAFPRPAFLAFPPSNQGRPPRKLASDKMWGSPTDPDEGIDEMEIEGRDTRMHVQSMKNEPNGASEGSIYVNKEPVYRVWKVEIQYGYLDANRVFHHAVYNMDLVNSLPPGISFRRDIQGQNLIAYSVGYFSPDLKTFQVLEKQIALPQNPTVLIGWDTHWLSNDFFKILYENVSFPQLMVPDSVIFPRELRGKPWRNIILLHSTKAALNDVFNKLSLNTELGFEFTIWYYVGKDENKSISTWSNVGGTPSSVLPGDDSLVVTAIQTEDNYSLMLLWFFAGPLMSKCEPARHFYKNREWLATMIFTKTDQEDPGSQEWQPFALPRTTAIIAYHMMADSLMVHATMKHICTIQEQERVRLIGAISLSSLFSYNSETMRRITLDPALSEYKNFWRNFRHYSEAFCTNFQPLRRTSNKNSRSWDLLMEPNQFWEEKPSSMHDIILEVLRSANAMLNTKTLGQDTQNSLAMLQHKEKLKHAETKKAVDLHSSPEYISMIESKKSWAEAVKTKQLKVLETDEAQKILKIKEIQEEFIALKQEKQEVAQEVSMIKEEKTEILLRLDHHMKESNEREKQHQADKMEMVNQIKELHAIILELKQEHGSELKRKKPEDRTRSQKQNKEKEQPTPSVGFNPKFGDFA